MDTHEKKGFSQTKIVLLIILLVILSYGKFLWPKIFGRVFNEGVSFSAAITDASLHASAFTFLIICWVVSYFLLIISEKKTNNEDL